MLTVSPLGMSKGSSFWGKQTLMLRPLITALSAYEAFAQSAANVSFRRYVYKSLPSVCCHSSCDNSYLLPVKMSLLSCGVK